MTVRRSSLLTAALSVGTILLFAPASHAQTTFLSTGFEASEGYSTTAGAGTAVVKPFFGGPYTINRAAGALYGQPGSDPGRFTFYNVGPTTADPTEETERAVNSTRVVNDIAASGSQSLLMDGPTIGQQRLGYIAQQDLIAGSGASLTVSTDMQVFNPSFSYGQWGLNLSRTFNTEVGTAVFSVAALGFVGGNVVAQNGEDSYAAFDLNAYFDFGTFIPVTANYGEFNNYSLTMDFEARTISGYLNGTPLGFIPVDDFGSPIGAPVGAMPFRALADNVVNLVSFGQGEESTQESAHFDNLRITGTNVVAAPEPGTFALVGVGLFGSGIRLLARRRLKQ